MLPALESSLAYQEVPVVGLGPGQIALHHLEDGEVALGDEGSLVVRPDGRPQRLEGDLTDAASGRIIRHVIVPHFKAGRFDQGLTEAVAAIEKELRGLEALRHMPETEEREALEALARFVVEREI